MSGHLLRVLALTEVRLRMRRLSTIVALLAVIVLSWAGLEDPAGGHALIVVAKARVLYTSSALALGSAAMASLLFSLAGFYLVRGRVLDDIRTGAGSVIAATPVGNAPFLAGRWLGAVAYLGLLTLAIMATMLVCHALRGYGPIQPLLYLLFDSWAPLMGKGGDILYFFLWTAGLSLAPVLQTNGALGSLWTVWDFSGLAATMSTLASHFDINHTSFGGSATFDPARTPLLLPDMPWTRRLVSIRAASAVLALLPLLAARRLFHRFSPDRVKVSGSRQRRSPLAMLDSWLRPLSRLVQPLFALAARLPHRYGQVVADVALTLAASPSAVAALAVALGASVLADTRFLGPLLIGCVAYWGVLVSDISTRDFQAVAEDMTGAVNGGGVRRYLRQYAAASVLGFMFMGVIALRFAMHDPVRGAAAAAGILSLAGLANMLGRCSRTPRTFLALFLFALYVAVNAVKLPMIDAVGFNGVANLHSALGWLAAGLAALAAGHAWNRRDA